MPVRFSRVTRLMSSVSCCIALNFGMTSTMSTAIEMMRIATAMPVASVHSKPSPAILHTAQTAMIGALMSICKPIVMNI